MKITTLEVAGLESALQGMRNPLNSWEKSDSYFVNCDSISCDDCILLGNKCNSNGCVIGDKDLDLAQRLIKGGSEHRKYRRMIQVWANFDMPRYWWSEFDQYRIAVTSNSCSTMHTISKREITIDDFAVDEKIKEILRKEKKEYDTVYRCELKKGEKEVFVDFEINGIEYSISNTGVLMAKPKIVIDSKQRVRHFDAKVLKLHRTSNGYFGARLGGRKGGIELIHRIIAKAFIPNPNNLPFVNHIDGDKGNNSVWNLEWCTQAENNNHAFENGLKKSTHYAKYKAYIENRVVTLKQIEEMKQLKEQGFTQKEIGEKFGIKQAQVSALLKGNICKDASYYEQAFLWESIIKKLNELRFMYIQTKDFEYIVALKRLLPEGFLQLRTVNLNYETIANIYHQRKSHRLKEEWIDVFCTWVESLPYAKELIIYKG